MQHILPPKYSFTTHCRGDRHSCTKFSMPIVRVILDIDIYALHLCTVLDALPLVSSFTTHCRGDRHACMQSSVYTVLLISLMYTISLFESRHTFHCTTVFQVQRSMFFSLIEIFYCLTKYSFYILLSYEIDKDAFFKSITLFVVWKYACALVQFVNMFTTNPYKLQCNNIFR
jgi:hypothetical protein